MFRGQRIRLPFLQQDLSFYSISRSWQKFNEPLLRLQNEKKSVKFGTGIPNAAAHTSPEGKVWMGMRKKQLLFLTAAGFLMLCCHKNAAIPADSSAALPDENRYIALTFDDGPHHDSTEQLLDGLRQRGASATFFLVGEEAEKEPDLVRRMQAEGHQVGNHTWGHMRLKKVTEETLRAEVGKNRITSGVLAGRR